MRYFFHIGYIGTRYSGWQKHAGACTVQQMVEDSLGKILKRTVGIVGCGRTDAGVHASQFYFHTDISEDLDFDLGFRLNKVLPSDIAVFDIVPVNSKAHARFDAINRRYDYFIHTKKDPFLNGFSSLYLNKEYNLEPMKNAASLLPLYNDYAAFCKSPRKNEHTICHVSFADIQSDISGSRFHFQISSNRFLGGMIRIIVGRLLKVGEGALSLDEFESLLVEKKLSWQLEPAYPQGLYLSGITYPYLDQATEFSLGIWR